MIRILLVDDSVTQREILRRLLIGDGAFDVVAEARNGREAVRMVEEYKPDVVVMDLHMPDMNGLEATREIMSRCPVPIIIASATLKKHDIDMGLEALRAGAVSVIQKPAGAVLLHLQKIGPQLRAEIVAASQAQIRRPPMVRPQRARPAAISPAVRSVTVVGICASTGGPPVLMEILGLLPRPYPVPILLVQHISKGFEEGFATWLSSQTSQPVRLATDGQRLTPGVWLAPGGSHLGVDSPTRLVLLPGQPADIHCPSGNPLFSSLAKRLGAKAAGLLLTGMGDDGARGLRELKDAGGQTAIQSEATCMIWGMPQAGRKLDAACYELGPPELAALLTRMAEGTEKRS